MELPLDHAGLYLSRDIERLGGDRRELSSRASSGSLVRVRRGAYADSAEWTSASPRAQHLFTMRAVALAADKPTVFSHTSAAAAWNLPILGSCPTAVHLVEASSSGGRSSHGIQRHGVDPDLLHVTTMDGLLVTSLEQTLIDLARTTSFASAVMSCDFALGDDLGRVTPLTTKERLWDEVDHLDLYRGRRRVERVIEFAVTKSGSPGESLSRSRFHELGFPAPILQREFVHHTGIVDRPDFDWEDFDHLGEFDGHGKYRDARMMNGLTAEDVVIREKQREDRLRTRRRKFSRWEWIDALHAKRLLAILSDAGLPRTGIRTR